MSTFPMPLPSPITAGEIVDRIATGSRPGEKIEIFGDADREITQMARLGDPGAHGGCLSFCRASGEKAARQLAESQAGAVFVAEDVPAEAGRCFVKVSDPRGWFLDALMMFFPPPASSGVHPTVVRGERCRIGSGVEIGSHAVLGNDVVVGDNTRIGSGVWIYDGTQIGRNCVVQSNTTLGASGMAFRREMDANQRLFPHLGAVHIGDDVEIGANSCVVRGILDDTVIESDTKIGNLVNVGHNCKVGASCWITSGVVLCGNVTLGPRTMVAAGASVKDYVTVGEAAQIGLGSVVTRNVAAESFVFGCPAQRMPKVFRF